eukprot:c12328_g1_i1.p1 GENE.c12328_g1_i1~~c12328_g1_i1.p1  ORF type:complete len:1013 (+),score=50.49 c12328_g1_i1:109-3147(+)
MNEPDASEDANGWRAAVSSAAREGQDWYRSHKKFLEAVQKLEANRLFYEVAHKIGRRADEDFIATRAQTDLVALFTVFFSGEPLDRIRQELERARLKSETCAQHVSTLLWKHFVTEVVDAQAEVDAHRAQRHAVGNPQGEQYAFDNNSSSALHRACSLGDTLGIQACLRAGDSVRDVDRRMRTPLHELTVSSGHTFDTLDYNMELLFNAGARFTIPDNAGNLPIHTILDAANGSESTRLALQGCSKERFTESFLFKRTTRKYAQNNQGLTPLMIACNFGYWGIASALTASGNALTRGFENEKAETAATLLLYHAKFAPSLLDDGSSPNVTTLAKTLCMGSEESLLLKFKKSNTENKPVRDFLSNCILERQEKKITCNVLWRDPCRLERSVSTCSALWRNDRRDSCKKNLLKQGLCWIPVFLFIGAVVGVLSFPALYGKPPILNYVDTETYRECFDAIMTFWSPSDHPAIGDMIAIAVTPRRRTSPLIVRVSIANFPSNVVYVAAAARWLAWIPQNSHAWVRVLSLGLFDFAQVELTLPPPLQSNGTELPHYCWEKTDTFEDNSPIPRAILRLLGDASDHSLVAVCNSNDRCWLERGTQRERVIGSLIAFIVSIFFWVFMSIVVSIALLVVLIVRWIPFYNALGTIIGAQGVHDAVSHEFASGVQNATTDEDFVVDSCLRYVNTVNGSAEPSSNTFRNVAAAAPDPHSDDPKKWFLLTLAAAAIWCGSEVVTQRMDDAADAPYMPDVVAHDTQIVDAEEAWSTLTERRASLEDEAKKAGKTIDPTKSVLDAHGVRFDVAIEVFNLSVGKRRTQTMVSVALPILEITASILFYAVVIPFIIESSLAERLRDNVELLVLVLSVFAARFFGFQYSSPLESWQAADADNDLVSRSVSRRQYLEQGVMIRRVERMLSSVAESVHRVRTQLCSPAMPRPMPPPMAAPVQVVPQAPVEGLRLNEAGVGRLDSAVTISNGPPDAQLDSLALGNNSTNESSYEYGSSYSQYIYSDDIIDNPG